MSFRRPVAPQSTSHSLELSIHEVLAVQAERNPHRIAITAPGRQPLRYGDLQNHVSNVVKTLNELGIGRNDRVAIVLPNGPEMAVAFLSIAAGATTAPLNPAYRADELYFYLSSLNVKAILIHSAIDSPARAVAKEHNIATLECSPDGDGAAGLFTLTCNNDAPITAANGGMLLPGVAASNDVALVLHTSGTASRPKIVPLTHANICTSASNIRSALQLAEEDRCLNVMPLFHIHGLIGATLSSLATGASVFCTPSFDVTMFFEWMKESRPTWYTAVPTMHQTILTRAEANRDIIANQSLRFIRSCSAALLPQVMANLERTFRVPVIDSYGMTEASHQIASNPLPPQVRKAGSVGVAAGPEIAIMDDIGNLLPPTHKGEIVIRGANVTQGYENNPNANTSAFTQGWFRTGDQGYLDADDYLFITGRLKEIINRAGEKISPRETDEVLMDHPAIAQAVTFAAPNALLGEEVAAAVVLRQNAFATESAIQEFVSKRLADFKVPRRVIILKDIPKGPTGKPQRIGLAERLGLTAADLTHSPSERIFVAPRNPLERQLTQIWEKVLAIKPIGVSDNFFDLGGYSMLAVRLIDEIKKETGFSFTSGLHILYQAPTIERLAELLSKKVPLKDWTSLAPIQVRGSKPPFFWIHGADSNPLLLRYLDPDQPLYGLLHQSSDGQPARYTTVETIAAHYLSELRTVQPHGPYFLGGHSFGAIVAFEIAQQLKTQNEEVGLLLLIAPASFSSARFPRLIPRKRSVSRMGQSTAGGDISRHLQNLAALGPRDQLRYVLPRLANKISNRLSQLKTPQKLAWKVYLQLGQPLPVSLRSPYILAVYGQAKRHYIPVRYDGTAVLFREREQPCNSDSELTLLFAQGIEVHEVDCNHIQMIQEPDIGAWAEQLQLILDRARETAMKSSLTP